MKNSIKFRKQRLERKLYRYSKVKSSIANVCSVNNQVQFAESYLEFYAQKKLELDPNIQLLESQPFTLIYQQTDRPNFDYCYTPDLLTTSNIDKPYIYEIKPSKFITKELEAKHKFFSEALDEEGIGFKVWTEKDIGNWLVMSNILMLSCYINTKHSLQTLEALASKIPPFSEYNYVLECAQNLGFQDTILMTLIAKGFFMFDMETPLTRKSLVFRPSLVSFKEAA